MKLGITTIQRDRATWIKEWVVFHYLVGFRTFYVYLHQCSDASEKILNELKKSFDIRVSIIGPDIENPQLKCYQKSYERFGNEVDWMAFIDGDEFLFPIHADTLDVPLNKFSDKKLSALGVYWSCFGSSGHKEEPRGLIIENYKYRAKDGYLNNRHIKSIVKGGQGALVLPNSPHFFQTPYGTYDENVRLIERGWTDYEPTYKNFRINHYVTQSRSFFLNFKSQVIPPDGADKRDESFWEEHDRNDVWDNSMNRFVVPVKQMLHIV